MTLLLSRSDISALLDASTVASAVEAAFTAPSRSTDRFHMTYGTAALHIVAGGVGSRKPFSVKVNLRTPDEQSGRQRVRGVILLFNPAGDLAAVMDSTEVTLIRTAVLVAISVARLGFSDAQDVLFVGSGNVSRYQVEFLQRVSNLRRFFVWSRQAARSELLVQKIRAMGLQAETVLDARTAARRCDVIVTMTPASTPLLGHDDVRAGSLVIALGADGPGKNELESHLLSSSLVVVDDLAQCSRSGELHHAIEAGLMTIDDVHGNLSEAIAGTIPRPSATDRVVVDSTGTALQDQAVASLMVRLAVERGVGRSIDLLA